MLSAWRCWLSLLLLCVAVAANHGCASGDSESHFGQLLESCDAKCAEGLSCVCGVCTKECTTDRSCADLAGGESVCLAVTSDSCDEPVAVCAVECESDNSCESVVDRGSLVCDEGLCQDRKASLQPMMSMLRDDDAEADNGANDAPDASVEPDSSGTDAVDPDGAEPDTTDPGDAGKGDAGLDAGADAGPPVDAGPLLTGPELELLLSDEQIWRHALSQEPPGIGQCHIYDNTGADGACDFYVKAALLGPDDNYGWPKGSDGSSTGCVYGPNYGRMVSTCLFPDLADELCTPDIQTNAINHVRDALRADQCGSVGRLSDYD